MARTLLGGILRNKAPIPYTMHRGGAGSWPLGHSGLTTPVGTMASQMRSQSTVGTLFSICDRIITAYAQVEWRLYRVPRDGRRKYHDKGVSTVQDDRIQITRHPALDLWNKPNPFFHGAAFRESTQQHEELTGEQYWVIVRNRIGLPQEMWFVRPDRMEPIPDYENYLAGYVYHGPGGEDVPLAVQDVIFQRRPNPLDPYRGVGAVQAILSNLEAQRLSTEWNRNFFLNSATPGGVIEADNNISDDDFNQFQRRWAETHHGVANAHRVAILEAGMKWVDRKYTMDDMQFVELQTASRETIREAFGFPKAMTGASEDVNKANAYAGEVMFARWLTKPRLMRTKEVLNHQLLPMYGESSGNLEFDFVNPVPEDDEIASTVLVNKAQAAKFLADTGFWEPAGILSTVGLPEMPEMTQLPAQSPPERPAAEADTAIRRAQGGAE
jgi:HK97 family phage portal protein